MLNVLWVVLLVVVVLAVAVGALFLVTYLAGRSGRRAQEHAKAPGATG